MKSNLLKIFISKNISEIISINKNSCFEKIFKIFSTKISSFLYKEIFLKKKNFNFKILSPKKYFSIIIIGKRKTISKISEIYSSKISPFIK